MLVENVAVQKRVPLWCRTPHAYPTELVGVEYRVMRGDALGVPQEPDDLVHELRIIRRHAYCQTWFVAQPDQIHMSERIISLNIHHHAVSSKSFVNELPGLRM